MKRAQNNGTTVIATRYDATSDNTTASASAEKRNLLTPNSSVTGKNTTIVVSVAASTGSDTSCPPFSAATSRRLAEFQVTVDILQHHHGVIDQTRKGQRQALQAPWC